MKCPYFMIINDSFFSHPVRAPRSWGEFPVWGSGPSPTLGATLCDTSCNILGYLRPDNMGLKNRCYSRWLTRWLKRWLNQ